MKTLYIIPTPIGNTEDITLRAIEVLFKLPIILCEDTRKTDQLLKLLAKKLNRERPKAQLIAFFEGNEEKQISRAIELIEQGADIGVVSNAGTPLVSDPGFKLVRECVKNNIKVVSLPGPSAVTAALSCSGLPTDRFMFIGFMPKKESKIVQTLESLPDNTTIIFFESPFRITKTLQLLLAVLGDVNIVICREMTKVFEEIRREKISVSIDYFAKNKPRGEFTILFSTTKSL